MYPHIPDFDIHKWLYQRIIWFFSSWSALAIVVSCSSSNSSSSGSNKLATWKMSKFFLYFTVTRIFVFVSFLVYAFSVCLCIAYVCVFCTDAWITRRYFCFFFFSLSSSSSLKFLSLIIIIIIIIINIFKCVVYIDLKRVNW